MIKKLFITSMIIISLFVFTGCSKNYYETDDFIELTPRDKLIQICIREGEYNVEEDMYSIARIDLLESASHQIGLVYYGSLDEISVFYTMIGDDDSKQVSQLWLESNTDTYKYGFKLLDENDDVRFIDMNYITASEYEPFGDVEISYSYPDNIENTLKTLITSSLTISISMCNELLSEFKVSLRDFNFIYF